MTSSRVKTLRLTLTKWLNKMKPYLPIAVLLLLASCGNGGNSEAGQDGKLQQKPAINEVEVVTLEKTDFPRQLLSNGKLSAVSRARLVFPTGGPVESIYFKNGQVVPAGATIARIARPDLQIALESAEINLQKAEMDLYDYLVGQGYTAKDTTSVPADIMAMARMKSGYLAAKNALARCRYDLSGTVLKAPFRGRVADIKLSRYDQAGSEPFCTLVDDSAFLVDFTVMESEYGFLSVGLPVRITPYADASRSYQGTIANVNPSVDKNGQILVQARIKGESGLLDGMNVKVTVERIVPGQLVVPRSAVVIRDNLDVLFTYTEDGKAHWTYVNILASNGHSHAVTANTDRGASLQEGDQVIISGNLNLADGSDVVLKK